MELLMVGTSVIMLAIIVWMSRRIERLENHLRAHNIAKSLFIKYLCRIDKRPTSELTNDWIAFIQEELGDKNV